MIIYVDPLPVSPQFIPLKTQFQKSISNSFLDCTADDFQVDSSDSGSVDRGAEALFPSHPYRRGSQVHLSYLLGT